MSNLDGALTGALTRRQDQSLYRRRAVVGSPQGVEIRRDGRPLLSFCSNDYLGLANHPAVIEAFVGAAKDFGVGSGASHLISGHSSAHHVLEEELAAFTGRERALLFSTGYMANLGVINALAGRGDAVFEDRLNHASLLDGALLSAAKLLRYRHNDTEHLQRQLDNTVARHKLIAVDGVFSMDGDFAALPALARCAQKNAAWLMVDDAHGLGCMGENGGGSGEHFHLAPEDIPILVGTLGKAFGTFGAFVAGSDALVETLIQFARPYIYTTAMPPAVAAATRVSLRLIQGEPERRSHLQQLIKMFRAGCELIDVGLMPSDTPIQPLLIGDSQRALDLARQLEAKGFWVSAIRPPTVPRGSARLRVTLSAAHSQQQVQSLLAALAEVAGEC